MVELVRTRWAAVGAAVAVTLGAGGLSLAQAAVDSGPKPVYIALDAPCRVVDTRPDSTVGPKSSPVQAGETSAYEIQITGDSGNCTGALAVPADALAVALNVTAIQPTSPTGRSFFTLYPGDEALPTTSNLNFLSGQAPVPNKVDVGLSATGTIKLYNAFGSAHAAVDIFGYYVDHTHDDRYYTETEVDTELATIDTALAAVDTRLTDLEVAVAPLVNSVAAFAGGNQELELTGASLVVRSVSLMPPADGTVIVNSSAYVRNDLADGPFVARCVITTGESVGAQSDFFQFADITDDGDSEVLAGTRGFDVLEGELLTVNFVCDAFSGTGGVRDSSLTAIFAPS